jgi:long-subunit fatty acid transport protein
MRITALALACSLALPFSADATNATLQQWKAYARQAVTPDFAWAAAEPVRVPSVLDTRRDAVVRESVMGSVVALTPVGQLRLLQAEGYFGFGAREQHTRLQQSLSPLSARYAATSLITPLGEDSRFSLTAIIARQRYVTQGFGSAVWEGEPQRIGVAIGGHAETSHGSGVRLGIEQVITPQLDWSLAVQSRLEMDAFKAYRGVYSEPGDFDVPGFVQTGLRWSPAVRTQIALEAQRVFYSDVAAITTAALPVRLLSLLGVGGSPQLAWRDLTVYSVETARETQAGGRWSLRYSTQQQPRPTSPILDRALSSQYSNTNLALGFQQHMGAFGRLHFAASYSPASYFLAAAPYLQREFDGGSQVEFEAHWLIPF